MVSDAPALSIMSVSPKKTSMRVRGGAGERTSRSSPVTRETVVGVYQQVYPGGPDEGDVGESMITVAFPSWAWRTTSSMSGAVDETIFQVHLHPEGDVVFPGWAFDAGACRQHPSAPPVSLLPPRHRGSGAAGAGDGLGGHPSTTSPEERRPDAGPARRHGALFAAAVAEAVASWPSQ